MKKSYYIHVLMAAGAALLMGSSSSVAMDQKGGPGLGVMSEERGMKREKGFWKEEDASLGLNEEQRAGMKALREEGKEKRKVFREQLKARHEALRQELDAENPDRAKAEGIVKELSALEQQMGLDRVDMVFKIRKILTPEQYKKLQAFHEKKRAGSKERRGKMKNKEDRK